MNKMTTLGHMDKDLAMWTPLLHDTCADALRIMLDKGWNSPEVMFRMSYKTVVAFDGDGAAPVIETSPMLRLDYHDTENKYHSESFYVMHAEDQFAACIEKMHKWVQRMPTAADSAKSNAVRAAEKAMEQMRNAGIEPDHIAAIEAAVKSLSTNILTFDPTKDVDDLDLI